MHCPLTVAESGTAGVHCCVRRAAHSWDLDNSHLPKLSFPGQACVSRARVLPQVLDQVPCPLGGTGFIHQQDFVETVHHGTCLSTSPQLEL